MKMRNSLTISEEETKINNNTLLSINHNNLKFPIPKNIKTFVNFSNFYIFQNNVDYSVIVFLVIFNMVSIIKIKKRL